jgi:hypothetical protein
MKRVIALAVLIGSSCLLLPAQDANNATVTGAWNGTFADSVGSGKLSVTLKQAANGDVSGTYKASGRGSGTVTGDIHADTLELTLTQKVSGCMGAYAGKLTVSGTSASGTFNGDDCNGKHQNGVISLALVSSVATSDTEPSNSPETSKIDYVPCNAPMVYLFKDRSGDFTLEELDEGSPVTIEGHEGDWFKVKSQSGNVGYIKSHWICKKVDYEAMLSKSSSNSAPSNLPTTTQPPQHAQPTGIPPGTMLAVAWRAQPWTTTTYYQHPGSSSMYCLGSGSWLGPLWSLCDNWGEGS